MATARRRGRVHVFIGLIAALQVGLTLGAVGRPAAAAPTTLVVNTVTDHDDGACDAADCTLREAIRASNATAADADTIRFNIPGTGVRTITPATPLPSVTGTATLDATTQPGYGGSPLIELDGELLGTGATGLDITGTGSTVAGLAINRFSATGLRLGGAGQHRLRANYIGTVPDGSAAVGSFAFGAVDILGSPGNIVGGTTAADRNVIVGALLIRFAAAKNNVVSGNYIGTDAAGTRDLSNSVGVFLSQASNNTIGGTAPGAGNVISGASSTGVELDVNSTGNVVAGNRIGTDATGTAAVANASTGVQLSGASGNTIGPGNIISGNAGHGVTLASNTNNTVHGNLIGVSATGGALGNAGAGVFLNAASHHNVIGGTASGAGNTIANNGLDGVLTSLDAGVGQAIQGNRITSNAGLGIDLRNDGLTANDAGDADTGPNDRQNFPILSSATTTGSGSSATGVLDSTANATFRVEAFASGACDPSGFGEGGTYLGAATVTTDASGHASFTASLSPVPAGTTVVTATATNAGGSTSEFSPCVTTTVGDDTPPTLAPVVTPNPVVQNSPATAAPNASDPESGIASASCDPVDTSVVGMRSVSCTATNGVGLSSTATASYRVRAACASTTPAIVEAHGPADLRLGTYESDTCIYLFAEQAPGAMAHIPASGLTVKKPSSTNMVASSAATIPLADSDVHSFLLHADTDGAGTTTIQNKTWTFAEPIIGVIYDNDDLATSDEVVGDTTGTIITHYNTADPKRGLEEPPSSQTVPDKVTVTGPDNRTLTVTFQFTGGTDEIRVITAAAGWEASDDTRWCRPMTQWRASETERCPSGGSTQAKPWGTYTWENGHGSFSAGGNTRAFPYIWTQDGAFPSSGDFVVDVAMRYTSIAKHGDGFMIRPWADATPTGSNSPFPGNPERCASVRIWAGVEQTADLSATLAGVKVAVPGDPRGLHHYRFEYAGGNYLLFVDGALVAGPIRTTIRADRMWIGNPIFTDWGLADWSDFTIESSSISRVTSVDTDNNGVADAQQAWPRTKVPASAVTDADSDGIPDLCDPVPAATSTIAVDKQTLPGSTDPFSFSLRRADGTAVDTVDDVHDSDAPALFSPVQPGDYVIEEDARTGWVLTAAACDNTDTTTVTETVDPAHLVVATGEDWLCRFTNTAPTTISVDKVTDPSGSDQGFDFTLANGGVAIETITDVADLTAPRAFEPVLPGTYTVTEAQVAGWIQGVATCRNLDDPESAVYEATSFPVGAGENWRCTFVNTARATISVDKRTAPTASSQGFDFTLSSGATIAGLRDADPPASFPAVAPGTYTVTEAPVAGWEQGPASCDNTASPALETAGPTGLTVGPGDQWLCTFDNSQWPVVLIDKVTTPPGAEQPFVFALGDLRITVHDGDGQVAFPAVAPGTYAVTEAEVSGWDGGVGLCDNTGTTATEGIGAGSLALAAGERWLCTFTNVERAVISVDKVAVSTNPDPGFDFTLSNGETINGVHGSDPEREFTPVVSGIYTVTETPVDGWDQTAASCTNLKTQQVVDGTTITVGPGERWRCTFTNVKRAVISVDKVTAPGSWPQPFEFALGLERITVADADAPKAFPPVRPGVYTVSETPVAGWDLTGATCDNLGTAFVETESPTNLIVLAGERWLCTFKNAPVTDLQLTILGVSGARPAGNHFDAVLRVTNNGPHPSPGFTVTATLPSDLILDGGLPTGCTAVGTTVTCTRTDTLAVGEAASVSLPLPVRSKVRRSGSEQCTKWGTSVDDTIVGTGARDVICGLGGSDTITGLGGNDTIYGDTPSDAVDYSATISGTVTGPLRDPVPANNSASATTQIQVPSGVAAADTIDGGADKDTIYGQAGNDGISGGGAGDTIQGNSGNDRLFGDAYEDATGLDGGTGNAGFEDTIDGGDGADSIWAQSSDDTVTGGNGDDTIWGQAGDDTLSGGVDEDAIRGGRGNDTIVGNEDNDLLNGNDGNDRLEGAAGVDRLYGEAGSDHLHGGTGLRNYLNCGPGYDYYSRGLLEDYVGCEQREG